MLDNEEFRQASSLPQLVAIAKKVDATASRKKSFLDAAATMGGPAPAAGASAGGSANRDGRQGRRPKGPRDKPAAGAPTPPDGAPDAPSMAAKGAAASGKAVKHSTCERCGRSHGGLCTSEFDQRGLRLPGTPPGMPAGWKSTYRGCKICGKADHLARACKDERQSTDDQRISVKAVRLRVAQLEEQARMSSAAAAPSPTKKRKRTMPAPPSDGEDDSSGVDDDEGRDSEAPSDEDGGASHSGLYGCSICGEGTHDTGDCEHE